MNRLMPEGMPRIPPFGQWDIGAKCTAGVVSTTAVAAAIAVPNRREKDAMAQRLYNKPQKALRPQEARVSEFAAGHKRWKDFWQQNVYPVTRKLPGSKNPIVNPYRDMEPMGAGQEEED